MITQLKAMVGFREEELARGKRPHGRCPQRSRLPAKITAEAMKTRIEDLDLSSRTVSALEKANIRTVGGLARKKERTCSRSKVSAPSLSKKSSARSANFGIVLK